MERPVCLLSDYLWYLVCDFILDPHVFDHGPAVDLGLPVDPRLLHQELAIFEANVFRLQVAIVPTLQRDPGRCFIHSSD